MKKSYHLLLIFVFLTFSYGGKAQGFLGKWYAKTMLNEQEAHYLLDIRKQGAEYVGYLDLPSEKIFRVRLDSLRFLNQKAVLFQHTGLNLSFEGKLNQRKETIQGTINKDEFSKKVRFFRQPQAKRTQLIAEPIPYLSRDVYFYNKDSTRLAGTLTLPKKGNNFKGVVLITGSGPQNRDEEILGHKPFHVLADYLTRQGIAVLRYDDRGYGESEGEFRPATSLDYAYDALAAVEFLKEYEEASITEIGLAGHSEGGNIAPVVATLDRSIGFLILLAAPGSSNYESYLVSLDLILKDYPETYDRDFPFFKSVYKDMAEIEDKQILKDSLQAKFERILKLMDEEELSIYGGAKNYIESEVGYHTSDWYHYYLRFDVTKYLEDLKIPILALNGDKDISVESNFNLQQIAKTLRASGNTRFETIELEQVNHFFQTSANDKIENVYFNEESFSQIALEKIAAWIKGL